MPAGHQEQRQRFKLVCCHLPELALSQYNTISKASSLWIVPGERKRRLKLTLKHSDFSDGCWRLALFLTVSECRWNLAYYRYPGATENKNAGALPLLQKTYCTADTRGSKRLKLLGRQERKLENPYNWEFTSTNPEKTHIQRRLERPPQSLARLIWEGLLFEVCLLFLMSRYQHKESNEETTKHSPNKKNKIKLQKLT